MGKTIADLGAAGAVALTDLLETWQGADPSKKAVLSDLLAAIAGLVVTQLSVDNLRLDGNTLSTTNANGDLVWDPDGTGNVRLASGRLQFEGASSGQPALRTDGSRGLEAVKADGSAYTYIHAEQFSVISGGVAAARLGSTGTPAGAVLLGSAGAILWASTANPNADGSSSTVGVIQAASGVARISNGGSGIGALEATREVEASTAGSGSPNLLAATESRKLLTNEGATAEAYNTLPSAVAGLEYVFYCQDTDGIRVVANAGDTIRIGANASASAGFVRSSTVGSVLQLIAINATEWVAVSSSGTWTIDA